MTLVYTAHNEVQTAIYALLAPGGTVDATLAGLGVTGVYDFRAVPQNAVFDYVTFGDGYELPDHTFDSNGYRYYPMLHIWSRKNDTSPASSMLNRINQLLDRQTFTLANLNNVFCLYQRSNWLADPDGLTLHVAITYLTYSVQ